MNPSSQPDLHTLKDIQLPDTVSWWPPAPIWWLLLALLVGLLLLLLYRLRQRQALRRAALRELARINANSLAGYPSQHLAMELSILLRRVALARMTDRQIAELTGAAWLQFLDSHSTGSNFSSGAGSVLIIAPYCADCEFDRPALLALAEEWIRGNT